MSNSDGLRILEYAGLDVSRVAVQYRKTCGALARADFRSAEVKKIGIVDGGGAGSDAGTALCRANLEKMKHAQGEVLYVTHSAFLAQSARGLDYPKASSAMARTPASCPTANSSRPCGCRPAVKRCGRLAAARRWPRRLHVEMRLGTTSTSDPLPQSAQVAHT